MATVAQMIAVSYNAVLNEARKPQNQWSENAFLRHMEKMGGIVKKNFGVQLEFTLDYQANPNGGFMASDTEESSNEKTEVLTSALYDIAEITVPIVWTRKQEVQNPEENQKVALVKSLITNALDSHDQLIEQALFSTTTQGFLGLQTLVPTSGQGTVGGIDAGTETWWRNPTGTYAADGSDIEATFTEIYNTVAKGSGSPTTPKLMVSGDAPHALFEGTQQPLQRWANGEELHAGFKVLWFKDAQYIFSQFGDEKVYFLNPKIAQVQCAKSHFRDKGDTIELEGPNAYKVKIYSALQFGTKEKSRLGVADEA